ncbi:MAG: hypothetical protein PHC97_03090 [Patescibacteria group bacterium]|nr:hypothetical protein [Patescibacteria group bacterium]
MVTLDMATEVPCTFTPAPAQEKKTEVGTKPTGPGVVEVPNATPKREKAKPIFFSGFENRRCEIPQSLIPVLQSTANTLKECKDCMLYHNGGVSLKTIPGSCHISTDENNPYFDLGPAPKNSKYKTLNGDRDCQSALATCRDDNFQKWFIEHGVNPAQLQPAELRSIFDYAAPDFLNRGVVGIIISTKELNGQSGKSGVIEIHVQNPGCDAKYKEPEICPLPPVILILTPRSMICTNCSTDNSTPAPQPLPPMLKQGWCFGLKEDRLCYIAGGALAGGAIGLGISQINVSADGASKPDGSKGGDANVSICKDDYICVIGGVGGGALLGWGIHEIHDKYIVGHSKPSEPSKKKVSLNATMVPTKGGAYAGVTLTFK